MPQATTRYGLPFPGPNEAPDGPGAIEALAKATDDTIYATQMPVGTIIAFAGAGTPPAGWLKCDGTTFSGATYPALQTLLGSTTTPNLSDRFLVGASGTKAVRTTGGVSPTAGLVKIRLVLGNVPKHTHSGSTGAAGRHDHGHSLGTNQTGGHDHLGGFRTTNWIYHEGGAGASAPTRVLEYPKGTEKGLGEAVGQAAGGLHSHSVTGGINNTQSDGGSTDHSHAFTTDTGAGLKDTPDDIDVTPPYYAVVYLIKAA